MADASRQLTELIGTWAEKLSKHPDIIAITIPGGVGGAIFYLQGVMRLADTAFSFPSLLLSIILGVGAGIVLIGLITNTDRTDLLRLVALAFLGGLAWPFVIDQGLNMLFGENGNSAGSLALALRVVETAESVQKSDSGRVDEQLESLAADFAENLPEEGPLRDQLFDTISARLASLEQFQRSAAIGALEDQVELNSEETQRLEDLRDLPLFTDRIEVIVPNHLMNPPDTRAELAETTELVTDDSGGIRFHVTEASRYVIQTRDSERDLVAALYSSAGGPPIVVDDDSGQELNPRIVTTLGVDEDYTLKLFDYNTGQEVGRGITVSFARLRE